MRTAAALGVEVDLDLLASVLARPAVSLLVELEAGARHGLLREDGSGFVFQHELVREALVAGTSAARRALCCLDTKLERSSAHTITMASPYE